MISDSNTPLEKNSSPPVGTELASGVPNGKPQVYPAAAAPSSYSQVHLWMHRVLVLLFVFVCAVVGVLLVILPWHPQWTDNALLLNNPGLRSFVSSGFVRGICSGLGVLDIWVGFWEAIHYREDIRPHR